MLKFKIQGNSGHSARDTNTERRHHEFITQHPRNFVFGLAIRPVVRSCSGFECSIHSHYHLDRLIACFLKQAMNNKKSPPLGGDFVFKQGVSVVSICENHLVIKLPSNSRHFVPARCCVCKSTVFHYIFRAMNPSGVLRQVDNDLVDPHSNRDLLVIDSHCCCIKINF